MRFLRLYKEKRLDTLLYQTYCSLMEAPTGFEPAIRQLQCRALPLGYRATYEQNYYTKLNIYCQLKFDFF